MTRKTISLTEVKTDLMRDPEFRAEYEALEPAFQVAQLRIQRGLTQKELADLVGTSQPVIARFESGRMEPRLAFLRRIVKALGAYVEVRIVPVTETVGTGSK